MRQTIKKLAWVFVLVVGLVPGYALAQNGPDARTSYELNMRIGPGAQFVVITTLPANTGLILEGRNGDTSWVLGHTEDGAQRGWVASLYLTFRDGFRSTGLPLSEEVLPAPAVPPSGGPSVPASADPAPALQDAPIIPAIDVHAREIFSRGLALGNNPQVFTKVGDCNTISHAFLALFNVKQYTLGPYSGLQHTLDFFSVSPAPGVPDSFANDSLASHSGYTAAAVLDPAFAASGVCAPGVSPLECEYSRTHPSVALIMLGLQDVHFLDVGQYEQSMRRIVEISLDRGVIPVLTTFPTFPGEEDTGMLQKRLAFNAVVVNLAHEYDVPLMNFWLAAQSLPHSGLEGDMLHLTYSGTQSGRDWISFGGEEQSFGFTLWNLITLRTLDQLQASVLAGS